MPAAILIVEDEMLLAMDLEDILVGAGYTVIGSAVDMHQAVAIAERFGNGIDAAIMDVNLANGTNGVETAGLLRQGWNIPSLFVSANIDEKMRARASQWNPIGFVGKPYSEREMLNALKAAFA
ncbi:two component response regulator [Fulvimarina pelagi HTCC2506]|uniref:Two component response regulator n=1 Tax=Fulvimarina pelagi HTCC2506 TaxID=314231 RepID=Q0FXG9_9HYPH|nr:response regulator [Fulvimarina pelagi]EAU39681.1 two component response regulator [Fulvimarina pelagi HTCC2506]